jgi:hypothetical protein
VAIFGTVGDRGAAFRTGFVGQGGAALLTELVGIRVFKLALGTDKHFGDFLYSQGEPFNSF